MRNGKPVRQRRGRGNNHGRKQGERSNHGRKPKRPNVLVIFGHETGQTNISAYSHGLMGYQTPHIDRIAREGMLFTDYYGEQSGTGGRAAFATGQSVIRSGLSKVGGPGTMLGMRAEDPTVAELLKPLGYATGQFGASHLGDRDADLPTRHGFDQFFGDRAQKNQKTAAPDKKVEAPDGELVVAAQAWIKQQSEARTPWFCWINTSQPRTPVKPEQRGLARDWQASRRDAMLGHDSEVGALLDLLDELDVADDTIVVYTTASGPPANARTDGASTPFRNEIATTFEGAFRVPALIRWPGKIKAGSVSNEIVSHLDLLPTILAAAGDPEIKNKLLAGHTAGRKTFKAHLDGYDLLPYLTGKEAKGPRQDFFYFSEDGDLVAMRHDDWKLVFLEERPGMLETWTELLLTPFVSSRAPKLFNLRTDPYEHADFTSDARRDWMSDGAALLVPARARLTKFLASLNQFPARQKAPSLTVDRVIGSLTPSARPGSFLG
jgi:arylsulfatase A-like enzyme